MTGTLSKERRREQNRAAQRRFREKHRQLRKATEPYQQDLSHPSFLSPCSQSTPDGSLVQLASASTYSSGSANSPVPGLPTPDLDEFGLCDSLFSNGSLPDSMLDTAKWARQPEEPFGVQTLAGPQHTDLSVISMGTDHGGVSELGLINGTSGQTTASPASSLHVAAQRGNSRIVRLLLENHADCNQKDSAGLTPLLYATIEGHGEVAELLLAHGAKVQYVDNQHRSALHLAVLHRRDGLLRKLLEYCSQEHALLDARTLEGWSPLFIAVDINHVAAVELLLEFGAKAR